MSIYRGAGGAGDAVADSSSEALLIRDLAVEVQADADAAATSATNAASSASAASTSASSASDSASAAATSATNAASSATSAASSASAASTSATNAANSATAAQTAETNAETAESGAATSATAAAASASTATTQASNANNSANAAATSATNASNSASAAATSATNAASSATSASGSASTATTQATNASNSATAAASSATSAAGSATTATTQAGIATTQATNAASSASAASTSATNAASSATAAAGSATTASTQATNAANSASAAATSETNAAASAAAAAASYDSFDDRYLGSKSAAPTLDNDGNALVVGALYYNNGTVTPADKGMYVYDGTQWIAASAASTAILTVFKYTATAGQTTFTGADDNALTLVYTAGSAIITLNGAVLEVGTDVTATSGTSIVLAQAALVGDEVNIYAFATFNIANTYTQAQTDATFLPKVSPSISSGNLTFATTGQRITGDFSSGTFSNRLSLQTSTTNAITQVPFIPNGTATTGGIILFNNSDPTNAAYLLVAARATDAALFSGVTGTGTYLPLTMYTGGSERLRIDTSGNVGIGVSNSAVKLTVYANLAAGTSNTIRLYNDGAASDSVSNNSYGFGFLNTTGGFTYTAGSGGYHGFYTANTERMRIDSSGNACFSCTGLSSSAPNTSSSSVIEFGSGVLKTRGDGQPTRIQFYWGTTQVGSVIVSSTATSYVTSSDYRLKENIAPMTGALDVVQQLKPVTYSWKVDGSSGQGFIAHELQEIVPDCVTGEKDAVDEEGNPVYQGIDTSFLVATLTAAIQEQQAMIEELKAKVAALEAA